MKNFLILAITFATMVSLSEQECTEPGLMCKSCNEIVICTDDGGEWAEEHVDYCNTTANEYCRVDQMGMRPVCDTEINPFCDGTADIPFVCGTHIGMYPDPFYCDRFHMCANGVQVDAQCDAGWAYDAYRTYCSFPSEMHHTCMKTELDMLPVRICREEGQNGIVDINPSIWYLCVRYTPPGSAKEYLYPMLHICKYGGSYVGNGQCIHGKDTL